MQKNKYTRSFLEKLLTNFDRCRINNLDFNFLDYVDLDDKKDTLDFLKNLIKFENDNLEIICENDYLENIHYQPELIWAISDVLLSDKEIVMQLITLGISDEEFELVGDNLKKDKELMLRAIYNYISPRHINIKLRQDRAFMFEVVSFNGSDLAYASDRLKDDEELVLRALSTSSGINFKNASKRLKNSEEFVLKALKVNASVINEVNASIKHDLKFINKAFKTNPNILIHLSKKFFNSIGFEIDFAKAMFAVNFNGILLTYLDENFKENEAVIKAALTNNTSAINYISEKKYKKYKKYLKHLDSDDDIPF